MLNISRFNTNVTSPARFEIGELTDEYGSIIFDGIEKMSIENTFMVRFIYHKTGLISFYINRKSNTLKTVSFVILNGFEIKDVSALKSISTEHFSIPVFDCRKYIKMASEKYDTIVFEDQSKEVEISHDNNNTVQILFGNPLFSGAYNNSIGYYFDEQFNLSGLLIHDKTYVPQLIQKIQH